MKRTSVGTKLGSTMRRQVEIRTSGQTQSTSDADLVVYDPAYRGVISVETQMMNTDYSGFGGRELEGRLSLVTVRGQVAVRDGVFVGALGRGAFLRREPTHF